MREARVLGDWKLCEGNYSSMLICIFIDAFHISIWNEAAKYWPNGRHVADYVKMIPTRHTKRLSPLSFSTPIHKISFIPIRLNQKWSFRSFFFALSIYKSVADCEAMCMWPTVAKSIPISVLSTVQGVAGVKLWCRRLTHDIHFSFCILSMAMCTDLFGVGRVSQPR